MSDHHHHHDHSGPIAIGTSAARVVVGLLVGIGVLVVGGVIWLWPSHQHVDIPLPMQTAGGGAMRTESGLVVMQDIGPCGSQSNGRVFDDTPTPPATSAYTCQRSLVSIDSGPHQGKHTLLEIAPGPGQPDLHAGDKIRLVRQNDPSGTPVYAFDDYSRALPLAVIALVFAAVIVAVARWRGLRAVLGLVFAFGVLVVFLLPALLDGQPALPVALVSGALILYAVLYLAHGVNLRTSSALLGTLSAMVLAAVLSWLTLKMTHVTGLSQEDNTNVATYLQHVSITGLLLAGFIIGSLGVLNDVTITQASAAFELAALDEQATRREVFAAAMRVGRDHIASTVYTLVLAYAGGALPLLLLFSVAGRSIGDVLTGDAVAIEITRSAVGGICLALSVPLTTAIAVLLARPFTLRSEPAAPVRSGGPRRSPGSGGATRRSERAGVRVPMGGKDSGPPSGEARGRGHAGEEARPPAGRSGDARGRRGTPGPTRGEFRVRDNGSGPPSVEFRVPGNASDQPGPEHRGRVGGPNRQGGNDFGQWGRESSALGSDFEYPNETDYHTGTFDGFADHGHEEQPDPRQSWPTRRPEPRRHRYRDD